MNRTQLLSMLSKACKKAGGQKAWAEANGLSGAYICDVLNERRGIGESILKALGYQKIVLYRKVRAA